MKFLAWMVAVSVLSASVFAAEEKSRETTGTKPNLRESAFLDQSVEYGTYDISKDFEFDILASEPTVAQPVHIAFDGQGRLWLTQYRQYPLPAGVKVIKEDRWGRSIYDKVTPPPPNHFKGRDKITVFEDTTGDGYYDKSHDFATGLNLATAALPGKDGVWVIMLPYLLFYPDANHDAVPDGPPVVHLEGFGMEDTHAVASSLHWGPDGWIYGAQGSTCTSTVKRYGFNEKGLSFKGHCIWRYHPTGKKFEVFAEGGGNTFSVSFNSQGLIFAGSNLKTLGFYYAQGGAYIKKFTKHGPHINPYSYGYLRGMKQEGIEISKLSQPFTIYGGHTFPKQYRDAIFSNQLNLNQVVAASLAKRGSNFEVKSLGTSLKGLSRSFRPVILKTGPDGSLYLGDWWDTRIGHSNSLRKTTYKTGRLYRLRAKGVPASSLKLNYRAKSDAELVALLKHPNAWTRRIALRLLGERQPASVVPTLKAYLEQEKGQLALEAFWALNLIVELDSELFQTALNHENEWVRFWAVRLIGDKKSCTSEQFDKMFALSATERSAHVRSQLVSTSARLPAELGLPLIGKLMQRKEDFKDELIPLLCWWSVEDHTREDLAGVVALFENKKMWDSSIVMQAVLPRLTRKAAEVQSEAYYAAISSLHRQASPEAKKTIEKNFVRYYGGFADDLKGDAQQWVKNAQKSLPGGEMVAAFQKGGEDDLKEGVTLFTNRKTATAVRVAIIRAIEHHYHTSVLEPLLKIINAPVNAELPEVQVEAVRAIQGYGGKKAYESLCTALQIPFKDDSVKQEIHDVLASRRSWAIDYLKDVEKQVIPISESPRVYQKLVSHNDEEINRLIEKVLKVDVGTDLKEVQTKVSSLLAEVAKVEGDSLAGKVIYTKHCVACHKIGDLGQSNYGPDLFAYERGNKEYFLSNIIAPSLYVREGYSLLSLGMANGSVNSGIVKSEDAVRIVLKTNSEDKQMDQTFLKKNIDETRILDLSPMPSGLLDHMPVQDVADLLEFIKNPNVN